MTPDTAATLIFDCDGVVLDSNRIKTAAFRTAALPWGSAAADALVAHHVAHGGVSRHRKFRHFLDRIVPGRSPCDGRPRSVDDLLAAYAAAVRDGLATCPVAEGLEALRAMTAQARWMIVSGGDQAELRDVFESRGLARLFDGGIFGSPDDKDTILSREIASGLIRQPALFLGDSRYDHEAARRAGLGFVFVSGWSEMQDWPDYVRENRIPAIGALRDLLGAR